MSEEQKTEALTPYEENWAIHSYLGINYVEAKKITDQDERNFLLSLAVYYKNRGDTEAEAAKNKENDLTNELKKMMSLRQSKS